MKTRFLVKGFTEGFDLGYRGPQQRRDYSNNIPLRIGSKIELWNKVMKQVQLKRYASPFKEKPPFEYFMQSPIGLVPKADDQTRLIFHLSYDFGESWEQRSFNYHTPDKMCSISYNDLDHAVANCLRILKQNPGIQILYFAKTDLTSAFRQILGHPSFYKWLCMKATNPEDGQTYYFVDKCLLFGASISCALFQELSDALAHIYHEPSSKGIWDLREQD